jgi:choline dehydrogenase-like flavoprotein
VSEPLLVTESASPSARRGALIVVIVLSYEAVLPYFKKSEHYEPGGDDTRGRGGPLNVAALRERAELADVFIEAAVAEGFPRNPDYNNGHQEGFGRLIPSSNRGRGTYLGQLRRSINPIIA